MEWKNVTRKLDGRKTNWQWSRERPEVPTQGDFIHSDRIRLSVNEQDDGSLYVDLTKPPHFGDDRLMFTAEDVHEWLENPQSYNPIWVGDREDHIYIRDKDDEVHVVPRDLFMALVSRVQRETA